MNLSPVSRTLFLILPALAMSFLCSGQPADSLTIYQQNLRKDLPIFSKIITGLHPLYNKKGIKEQVSDKLDSLYRLNRPLSLGQIGAIFRGVNTGELCTDSHTSLHASLSGLKVWPYAVRIIGNKVYINQDSVSIPFGAEITSINGRRPTGRAFDTSHVSAGRSDPELEEDFSELELAWPIIWAEENGSRDNFEVDYKWQNKQEHVRLEAVPMTTYLQSVYPRRVFPSQFWRNTETTPVFYLIDKAGHSAYICLNTFDLAADSLRDYMDKIFRQLRVDSISGLVIDLTHNGGGSMNNIPLLYSYLTDKPFDFSNTLSIDKKVIPLRQYLTAIGNYSVEGRTSGEIDQMLGSLWDGFKKTPAGIYERKYFQTPFDPAPEELRFSSKYVYILISGQTESAACAFSALVKVNKRGTLIGMRTGGKAHFIDAGLLMQYKLPNSGAVFSVPLCHATLDFADSLPEGRCAALAPDQQISTEEILKMFLNRDGNPPAYNKLRQYLGQN